MKRWISKLTKLAVVMAMLSIFVTAACAEQVVEVTAVKLDNAVEIGWNYLAEYKGMDVWCALYDADGKMLAVKQTDMNARGQACRVPCDPAKVGSVKLFLLGEELAPAEDVKIPGSSGEAGDHICVWSHYGEGIDPTFLEPGLARSVCEICGKDTDIIEIPPLATPEERVLVDRALDLGLLQYVCDEINEIEDLGEATRLDVAKMLPIAAEFDNYDEIQPSSTTKYADCADLTDMEKGILNAVSGFMTGDGNGNFKPHAKVTRAELAYVFFRAMGHPYPNEVTTYTDVAEDAWYHKEVTYLHSLGLLDDEPEFRPTDNATKADLLKWFSNGVLWAGDLTDRMAPTNLRFDAETNGKWLYWDGAKSELRNLWYVIGMRNANTGRWEDMEWIRADEESEYGICTRWRFAGEYDRVSIMAQTENGKPYGGMGRDMSMTIYRDENTDAEVKLVDTDNGRALKITNLPANESVRVILVTEPGDFGNYNDEWSRRTDDNGELLIYEADYDTDFFSNELWYAIESFGDYTLSSDGMELKYTVTCYGEGYFDPSTGIGTNDPVSDPDYEVGNVYFDMFMGEVPVMYYTLPDNIDDDDVRVDLYIPDDNGEWHRVMGSNMGWFWVDWLEPGVYDRFKVVTTVDDEEKGWVIVDDLKLTINPGGVSNAQVTFEKIYNTYHWKAVNGQPETCFSIEVVEEGAGSFRPTGYFDENGVGDGTESGEHAISHIENGTFVLREYRDLEISDRDLTVSVWATEEKNCLPMDPAYAVTNLHFEKNKNGTLFIAWDAPAAVAKESYVEYAFQFYRAGDDSKNDWSGRTDQTRLAMWKFGATNYDRLYVKTIVRGVAKGEQMFQGNLVTITEGTAPDVQLTYTQTGHDYEMQLVGKPNTCYVTTYQNPRNGILTTEYVTDASGVCTDKINGNFDIDCIENGSINVMTYGNLSYSGSSCSYTANATGWMKGSDMIIAAPNNAAYAVSNVRFGITGGGISLLFDEPENVTGELTYDLYMVEAETGRKYGRGSSYSKPDQLNYFFLGSYDEGVYEDMVIYTYVDGELKSWVELEDYCLNLEYNGESDARADFVFTGESENKAYDYTVTGTPNSQFAIEMRNENGSTNHFGTLDANGSYTRTGEDGENTTSRIESGNCFVREYDELNISADGSKCDVIYRDSKTWKCLRGYGYVTSDPEMVMNDKGDRVDEITFWDGEEDLVIRAKHQFTGVLAKGDFFSYRMEVRDDGERRLGEIIKNDGEVGEVTACGAGITPEWIKLDGEHYDCVEPPILVYVDGEEREGVLTEDYSIETGKSIRYVLNDVGKIAAVFVDVYGDIEDEVAVATRGYGYVTALGMTQDKWGMMVDYVRVWNGEKNIEFEIKSDLTGQLSEGDFFSYELDGASRIADIRLGTDVAGTVTDLDFDGVPDHLWVDNVQYDGAEGYVMIFVNRVDGNGVSASVDDIRIGNAVEIMLDARGDFAAVFVDVSEAIEDDSGDSDENPYAVSNVRFVNEYGSYRIKWDVPDTTENLRYSIYARSDRTGQWERLSSTSQNILAVFSELDGSYTGVKVVTELNREEMAEEINDELSISVTKENRDANASVNFVYNAQNDMYDYNISGLSSDASYCMVRLRETPDDTGYSSFGMSTNGDGTANGSGNNSSMAEILSTGGYLVMEFSDFNLSTDETSLSYTITQLGDWANFSAGDEETGDDSGENAYAVSNIRFEEARGQYSLKWDAPETTESLRYYIYGMNPATGSWERIRSTRSSSIVLFDELNCAYTGIKVATKLGDEEVAEAVNNDLVFNVQMKDGGTGTGVQFVYNEGTDMYDYTVTGLNANAHYCIIWMCETVNSGNINSFGMYTNGDGTANGSGSMSNLPEILESGYYRVTELSDYSLSEDGNSLSYVVTRRGDWTEFNP